MRVKGALSESTALYPAKKKGLEMKGSCGIPTTFQLAVDRTEEPAREPQPYSNVCCVIRTGQ